MATWADGTNGHKEHHPQVVRIELFRSAMGVVAAR